MNTEELLINIWKKLFQTADIDETSNFFYEGGSSFAAIQLSSIIHKKLKKTVPVYLIFENPILRELAEVVEKIEEEKEEKLVLKCDREHIFEPFELTDIQYAYWFGSNQTEILGKVATHAYIELVCRDWSILELEDALNKVIAHQPMLRIRIMENGYQRILPKTGKYCIPTKKCITDHMFRMERETVRNAFEQLNIISTNRELLIIEALEGKEQVSLHMVFNSIIFDGKSIFLFLNEWNDYLMNPEKEVVEYQTTYRDYMTALSKLKDTKKYEEDKAYVLSRLEEMRKIPELPLRQDVKNLAVQTISHHVISLETELWKIFQKKCLSYNITPNAALMTIYAQTLALWSSNLDFTINFTCFDRLFDAQDLNRIIGDFTILLLLPISLRGKMSFWEQAAHVQEEMAKAIEHKNFGTIDVEREMAKRYGRGNQFFPIVYTGMIGLDQNCSMPGEISYLSTKTSQVWLDMQVIEINHELMIRMEAVEELLPYDMVEQMLETYLKVVKILLEDKSWKVEKGLLTEIKNPQIREDYNHVTAPLCHKTLDTLVIEQAARTPELPAIYSREETLSYQELYDCAYQLSRLLRNIPGKLVAVMLPRSAEEVVAVLGILMSGKAYVPIDIKNPAGRKKKIMSHIDSGVVILRESDKAEGAGIGAKHILHISNDSCPRKNPKEYVPAAKPQDTAYVIFTSGSTGEPKGVVISHQGAVNTILDVNKRFKVTEGDCTIGLSNLNFDLSVYDIFGMLVCGGAKAVVKEEEQRNPEKWLKILQKYKVTVWNSVPAFWQMMVEYVKDQTCVLENLRLVLMSGDRIPADLPDAVKKCAPNTQIVCLGGATEASIWSNYFVADQVKKEWGIIPYGYPLTNQKYYVLNDYLVDCPDYVKGRLYIGGEGLATEYLGDEIMTKKKFIWHPVKQEQLYDTGDEGRYWSDGTIEFLGRADFQVKIHGHRIELGEIEAAFEEQGAIERAVAVVVKKEDGKDGIAVAVKLLEEISLKECLIQVEQNLPKYMIPFFCERIDQIPLTENGKIDRKILAEQLAVHVEEKKLNKQSVKTYIHENTLSEIQKQIIEIWEDLLGYEVHSLEDEFYENGGDSLKMIRFINLAKEKYKILITPEIFFAGSTIKELAENCR